MSINGGRPRLPLEAAQFPQYGSQGQYLYTSANTPITNVNPPIGSLTAPDDFSTVTTQTLHLEGWASDAQEGLNQLHFLANTGGSWAQIGPDFTSSPAAYDWDLCAAGVSDGPLSVALFAKDNGGNQSPVLDVRRVVKDYTCTPPPPACTPAANQVALFTGADYGGSCVTLGVGSHLVDLQTGALTAAPVNREAALSLASRATGGSDIGSILVGSDVVATLYREVNFTGRAQTLAADDSNLADDWIGDTGISLAYVSLVTTTPFAPLPAWPAAMETFTGTASLSLVWDDGGGATGFQSRMTTLSGTVTSTWGADPVWHLGSLSATGTHSWQVRAKNLLGGVSAWSQPVTFTVSTAPAISATQPVTAPYADDMESGAPGWEATGLWNLLEDANAAHSDPHAWWYGAPPGGYSSATYDTGAPNTGDLTSPPIYLPAAGYTLQFWYRYVTESPETRWDQRWVQISAAGGPFTNVLQLSDDYPNINLHSASLDLSPYAGQTVRIRFHFETLDNRDNAHAGWVVDDVNVSIPDPVTCPAGPEPNDTPAQATSITPGDPVTGTICGPGDVDYFSFTGQTGDQIGLDLDAAAFGSPLDTYVFLLDGDGASVLAKNDDQWSGFTDSFLSYRLQRDGTYFVKVRAWNHPTAGGANYTYTMTLSVDAADPVITDFFPRSNLTTTTFLHPTNPIIPVTATVTGTGSAVNQVEFLWHSGSWELDNWQTIGIDMDGSDGWGVDWNTTGFSDQLGMAVFIRAMDRGGNISGVGVWNLGVDRTPPVTTAPAIPASQETTAVHLEWSGTDNLSSIKQFDTRYKWNGTGWQSLVGGLDPATNELWFTGTVTSNPVTYSFRIRAVDMAGNPEAYLDGAELTTMIQPCTAPDGWESDDAFTASSVITSSQTHNFCSVGDEDWVRFDAAGGTEYLIVAHPLHATSAAVIELYASDGTTRLARATPLDSYAPSTPLTAGFGLPTFLAWEPSVDTTYYIRVTHLFPGVFGNAVQYVLSIQTKRFFMPLIFR